MRIPPFWPERLEIWFNQIEAQFTLSGITADNTKFSENKKMLRLFEQEEIGDRTPSQLLRHMQSLAGKTMTDSCLKTLWANRLPAMAKAIISSQIGLPLDVLADIADRIHEGAADNQVASVSTARKDPLYRLDQMEARIAELYRSRPPKRSDQPNYRGRSKSKERRRSASPQEQGPLLVPPGVQGAINQMQAAVRIQRGKRTGTLNAAISDVPKTCRLFVRERTWNEEYLINTRSDLCVYPRSYIKGRLDKAKYEQFAANGSIISTYGLKPTNLDLGLRRNFTWRFVIADVSKPIIGADFLTHYGLLVDLKGRRLLDETTTLTTTGRIATTETQFDKAIMGSLPYQQLLAEFSILLRYIRNGR
nr:uncharacterized protein LOC117223154 [Megalopta genalis]